MIIGTTYIKFTILVVTIIVSAPTRSVATGEDSKDKGESVNESIEGRWEHIVAAVKIPGGNSAPEHELETLILLDRREGLG